MQGQNDVVIVDGVIGCKTTCSCRLLVKRVAVKVGRPAKLNCCCAAWVLASIQLTDFYITGICPQVNTMHWIIPMQSVCKVPRLKLC